MIYDTLGVSSFAEAKGSLTRSGRYVCPVLGLGLLGAMLRTAIAGTRKARFSATGMLKPDVLRPMLATLVEMVEDGKLVARHRPGLPIGRPDRGAPPYGDGSQARQCRRRVSARHAVS